MTESPAHRPGLDALLGVSYEEVTASRVVLKLPVEPKILQPFGIVHGGVHCSLVESAASIGAAASPRRASRRPSSGTL